MVFSMDSTKSFTPTGFITRSIRHGQGQKLYQVYVPSGYTPDRGWPVILFLHGAGEGGDDALLPTEYQLGSAIRRNPGHFPGLVVFPQIRRRSVWTTTDIRFALKVLAHTRSDYSVDPDRIYLTGVSSGARAAWTALSLSPKRFAAALIVCGYVRCPRRTGVPLTTAPPLVAEGDDEFLNLLATRIRDVPVWIFHGDADPVFPVADARNIAALLQEQGGVVRYTELAGFGHDVWDVAYYSEAVADWLFSQFRVH
jgi:predicted peptidase